MDNVEKLSFENLDGNIEYDFNNEKLMIMVLGRYVMLKKPLIAFILNILYMSVSFVVLVFLVIMSIVTITFKTLDKSILVHVIQTLCLVLVAIALPGSKLYTDSSLDVALRLIYDGVHKYQNEDPDDEPYRLKKARVDQIRFLMYWVTRVCFSCVFSNALGMPIIQLFTVTEATGQVLNPYLPLPIYMPFNTFTFAGYSIAYFTNAIFIFCVYISILCLIETFLSITLQLVAQLEILNLSLQNIQRRAYSIVRNKGMTEQSQSTDDIHFDSVVQKQMYLCLRENILHHLSILR